MGVAEQAGTKGREVGEVCAVCLYTCASIVLFLERFERRGEKGRCDLWRHVCICCIDTSMF